MFISEKGDKLRIVGPGGKTFIHIPAEALSGRSINVIAKQYTSVEDLKGNSSQHFYGKGLLLLTSTDPFVRALQCLLKAAMTIENSKGVLIG